MKLLILAALVAVAVADYHDDTFHFSTLGSSPSLTGLTAYRTSGLESAGFARQAKQYTVQAASPAVYSSFSAKPAYTQYSTQQLLQPAYTKKYTVQQVAQPAYTEKYTVQQVAQPAYVEKYSVQPAYAKQYSTQQFVQPAYTQEYSAVKQYAAKPLVQQYSALSGASAYAANAPQFRILSQVQEADPAGPYKLSYSTENGIQVSEQGALANGAEGPAVATQGSYSYTGPDGQVYTVNWIADENGYRASGDHLPVPPPVPAEILKSLEEIARSGSRFDEQGRPFRK
ncbi:uncharacterized protein LOC117651408 [Thrips palmi]|uniref:Uncharacterized protein LOC117651408 n=1 Tax=Thrips palmi TaxID=161013 RepID=A0A6P9A1P1_THRPL|nr:uncharacterized protein LOC117651408 [Thrips palmi]